MIRKAIKVNYKNVFNRGVRLAHCVKRASDNLREACVDRIRNYVNKRNWRIDIPLPNDNGEYCEYLVIISPNGIRFKTDEDLYENLNSGGVDYRRELNKAENLFENIWGYLASGGTFKNLAARLN